jgi:23S rRNA pseudouridine2605 synthase
MQERVQKFISSAGVASRRKAEEFIKSGQVLINGKKAKLGDKVNPETDVVKVYGKIIKPAEQKIYIALNKPKGYVVSKQDPLGRKTVFSLLPDDIRTKVWNVGRLDYETEGLLILTNDGELTQELSHPKYEHEKEYEAATSETPTKEQLNNLAEGVMIATGQTAPAHIQHKGNRVYITIHEGKKHQVRRMMDAVGLDVINLKRVRINRLKLPDDLKLGQYKMVKKDDII